MVVMMLPMLLASCTKTGSGTCVVVQVPPSHTSASAVLQNAARMIWLV